MIWIMLAPAAMLWSLFVAWPLYEMIRVSLVETNYITTEYVGLANYIALLSNGPYLRACLNSVLYIVLLAPMTSGIALSVAFTVRDMTKRWQDAARLVCYIPSVAAGVIIASVWKWIFHYDGPINWLIGLFRIAPITWMKQSVTAIPVVSLVVLFSGFGGMVIIYLAQMLSIDHDLFDAAKIDGASRQQVSLRIVLPIILPMVLSMCLLTAIAAPQIFETIYAMGPYEHVATVGFHIYTEAFVMSRHGMAAAMSVILLIAMVGLAYARQRLHQ